MKPKTLAARVKAKLAFTNNYVHLKNGWCARKKTQMRASVVLIGFMGSGKSSIGPELATAINGAFIDTDTELEKKGGKSISDLFAEFGEIGFRQKEAALMQELLDTSDRTFRRDKAMLVIAAGGGAVIRAQNRRMLKQSGALVVWLNASFSATQARLAKTTNRPLYRKLKDSIAFEKLYNKRFRLYKHCASLVVYNNAHAGNTDERG